MRRLILALFLTLAATLIRAQGLDNTGNAPSAAQLDQLEQTINANEARNRDWQRDLDELDEDSLPATISENNLAAIRVALEQTHSDLTALNNTQASVAQEIEAARKRSDALSALLQKQSNPLLDSDDGHSAQTREQLALSQRHLQLLQRQKHILAQTETIGNRQKALLEARYQRYNERYLETRQTTADQTHSDRLNQLQARRQELNDRLDHNKPDRNTRLDHNNELALINTQIYYTQIENELLAQEARLQEIQYADLTSLSLERIDRIRAELAAAQARLDALTPQIDNDQHLISQQNELYTRQRGTPLDANKTRQQAVNKQYQQLKTLIANNTLSLKTSRDIADRQYSQLAKAQLTQQYRFGGDPAALAQHGAAFLKSASTFIGQYIVAVETLYHSLRTLPTLKWLTIASAAIGLIAATIAIINLTNRAIRRYAGQKRLTFPARLLYFLSKMLKNNLPYLTAYSIIHITIRTSGITAPASDMLALIPALLLFNTIPYYAARNLIHTELIAAPEKQRIIRPTIIYAAVGSLLYGLVCMAEWILDDQVITDTYRWIFALYNLLAAVPIWRATSRSIAHMNGYYRDQPSYRSLRLLIRAIPLGVAAFGIVGTLGYLNLAWNIARHLLIFVLYASLWIAFTALLKDSARRAKHYALRHTTNGVFWAQDIINPANTILTYASLILLLRLLQYSYGWNEHTPVIQETLTLLNAPIAKNDSHLTLLNILLMGILIYIIYRIGGWIKSLSYRWIYGKIADLGIRNSLAVFSQYAAVTLGFFLALRVIGIDLTAFTVFAGALGVGIGFGMQTIANNFISGILLLIERPLRNGDIITVGNYEGTVERIGMRSLTITTFDNESVILPNSDFVTSAFKNWSHQDPITRTVLYLDLGYRHDPEHTRQLLLATLRELAEEGHIVDSNEHDYGVFAYDYSDRGITYRVQYHVHMQNHNRLISRHLVIERLWQVCRMHGIDIAYPKRDNYYPLETDQPARLPAPRKPV